MKTMMIMMMAVVVAVQGDGIIVSVGDREAELLQNGAPTDGAVPDWCQKDADCTRQGDTAATCVTDPATGSLSCDCTGPIYVGEICYEKPTDVFQAVDILGIFVITFPDADCSQFKSIVNAISTFDSMFEVLYAESQTYYLCGSLSIAVELTFNAVNATAVYTNLVDSVSTLASHENYTTALGYTGNTDTLKTSFHPDPGAIPTCIVLNAKKTIIVEGVCRALVCNPGYVPYDEFINGKVVPACELDTEGDDAALTDSAIAGIIFGILLLGAMVGLIIWHFTRGDPEDEGIPVNDPYNENPPEAGSSIANEPYGKKEEVDDEDESANEDIAV